MTQEICNEVMSNGRWAPRFIPDHFKTQEMCNKAVRIEAFSLFHTPDHFKTQEMYIEAVRIEPTKDGIMTNKKFCNLLKPFLTNKGSFSEDQ